MTLIFILTRTPAVRGHTKIHTCLPLLGRGEGFYSVRNAAGQPVCAYIERVNGTSQSDVELERARRANEIHRSTQLTNCSPSVIRHCSLCLSSLSFSRASIPRRSEEPAPGYCQTNRAFTGNHALVPFVIFSALIERARGRATLRPAPEDSPNDPLDRRSGHVYWSLGLRIDGL